MLLALSLWLFALGSLLFCLSLIAYHLLLIAYCFPKNLSSRASRAAASRGTTHLHLLFLSRNSKHETRNCLSDLRHQIRAFHVPELNLNLVVRCRLTHLFSHVLALPDRVQLN